MKKLSKTQIKTDKKSAKKSEAGTLIAATTQPMKTKKARRQELLRCCAGLAAEKDILGAVRDAIGRLGLVGEIENALILFLAVVSRIFAQPVSAVVKGTPSGGKNTLVDVVLKLFSADAYYRLTSMSDKALAYLSVPLKHRMLVVTEAAGISEGGAYFLRTLLSEGFVGHQATKGTKSEHFGIEGPTGVISTTTHTKLNPDEDTRVISLEVADSPEQTRRVLRSIAQSAVRPDKVANTEALVQEFRAFTDWVAAGPRSVEIPFAVSIADLMSDGHPRLRRDMKTVLALVSACALVHQRNREVSKHGAVVASIADYRHVARLVRPAIAQGVDAAVSASTRRLVDAVAKLAQLGHVVTAKKLADQLGRDKSTVSRTIQAALESGYVRNLSAGSKKTAKYALAEKMPSDNDVLPLSKAVLRHHQKRLEVRRTKPLKKKIVKGQGRKS